MGMGQLMWVLAMIIGLVGTTKTHLLIMMFFFLVGTIIIWKERLR